MDMMSLAMFMAATTTGVLSDLVAVFDAIGTWLLSAITKMLPIFYSAETGLTILGCLATASLAFGVIFLVVGLIQKFFHFRG